MNISHPLAFFPAANRKRVFWVFFILTLGMMTIFQVFLDPPLRPYGIVAFELAATPPKAGEMLSAWGAPAKLYAAFGLGFDFLFMPVYATALSVGVLMASTRRGRIFEIAGAVLGWGGFAATLFDATENIQLFQILLTGANSPHPEIAAFCANIKFVLLLLGLFYALFGWIFPNKNP